MWLYNLGLIIYGLAIRLVASRNPKAKLWIDGRKDIFRKMEQVIDPSARIVWIHVASLGEFEQGRPVIDRIREEHPEYKILLTFYSPSGYEVRKDYKGVDYIFYLPLDTASNAKRFIDIVNPEMVILVKYEFWINMLSELRRRNIRTYIISAIFRRNSIFFRHYGGLWRQALESFYTLFVQNNDSKKLLAELGFDNVVISGDTRFDRVLQISESANRIDIVERFKGDSRLFVAGSTWEADEEILVELMNLNPQMKFVVAPHELKGGRIDSLISRCSGGGVKYTDVTADTDFSSVQVLVLNTMGQLSSVYQYASISYIGGGFGVGIHNILEAATFGLPIAFGPNYQRFKEARDLVSLGGAKCVCDYQELREWFDMLNSDDELLNRQSRISKDYTVSHQGATSIIVKTIFSNLD